MRMHGAGDQDHRAGDAIRSLRFIGEDNVGALVVRYRLLGFSADAVDGGAQRCADILCSPACGGAVERSETEGGVDSPLRLPRLTRSTTGRQKPL